MNLAQILETLPPRVYLRSGELVIHPRHRRQGLGLALVSELIAQADGHRVQLWAHGDLPAAAALAREAGFERFRALWQMRRSLLGPIDQPVFPAGSTLHTFRPGRDEQDDHLGRRLRRDLRAIRSVKL